MPSGRTPETGSARSVPVTVRLSPGEMAQMEAQRVDRQFVTASAYLRWLVKNDATPEEPSHG